MCAKDRRSHDQKRKVKLAQRVKRSGKLLPAEPQPYAGSKYQAEKWVPHVYATELGIYEGIVQSQRTLTNEQVREAIVKLIEYLRAGNPALLEEDTPDVPFSPGKEVEYLVWNVRRRWGTLVDRQGPVVPSGLVGILRTLLHSMEAHAWNTGKDRGYVDFLYGFMQRF